MIMRPGQALLLPASPLFIALTLLVALVFDMLPLALGPAMPELLPLVLVCWNVHQSRRVGLLTAFVLGLVIDVHQGALLGQHGLAYTLLAFGAVSLHRRLLWFGLPLQALHLLPLFLLGQLVMVLVRLAAGDGFPGWSIWLAPLIQALAWPLAATLLLAPQRRAPDPDENRPL